MNIIERIYQVFDYKGDSVYKISKKIDVSNGYFSKKIDIFCKMLQFNLFLC